MVDSEIASPEPMIVDVDNKIIISVPGQNHHINIAMVKPR